MLTYEQRRILKEWINQKARERAPYVREHGKTGHLPPGDPAPREELTACQREVLRLISHGLSDHQIGVLTYRSINTVKRHVALVLTRLNARNRAHAVAIGYETGLLSEPAD